MKYHCIKQHDITDCGAACLATICRQNGYKTSISRIREVAGTDKQGTNVAGVIKAADQLGFNAKGVKGNKEAFFSEFPLPCRKRLSRQVRTLPLSLRNSTRNSMRFVVILNEVKNPVNSRIQHLQSCLYRSL